MLREICVPKVSNNSESKVNGCMSANQEMLAKMSLK